MSNYILDKAYKITDANGAGANLVVVQSTNDGECALPGAANAPKILGVTTFAQATQNKSVSVRKAGIAKVVAAGSISAGNPVNIAGTSGKVKAINESGGTLVNCVGFAETSASADGDNSAGVFADFPDQVFLFLALDAAFNESNIKRSRQVYFLAESEILYIIKMEQLVENIVRA